MRGSRIYIAGPFFTAKQLAIIQSVENALLEFGMVYFSPRTAGVLGEMAQEEQDAKRTLVYRNNIIYMEWCTHMVACVEHSDRGTAFEIGYYAALSRPIALYTADLTKLNVMLAEAACGVTNNLDDLLVALDGKCKMKVEQVK